MSENNTQKQHRLLKISILRYNPADPASVPHMQTFELEEIRFDDLVHCFERNSR